MGWRSNRKIEAEARQEAERARTTSPVVTFSLPDGWTYSDLQDAICEAVCEKYGKDGALGPDGWESGVYPWLRNFDDKNCWYCLGGSEVYQEGYSVDGTEVTLADNQIEVEIMWKAVPSTKEKEASFDGIYQIEFPENIVKFDDDGMAILRTGLIFKAGDYPDKNFSITSEELKEAAANFTPVLNKGSHNPTIFDGKMGTLESVEVGDDGVSLFGTIKIPKWMQELHGPDNPMSASLEWRRDTKRIYGNTIIPNPRVAESVLMAAFSKGEEGEEKPNVTLGDAIKAILGLDRPKEGKVVEMAAETTDQAQAIAEAVKAAVAEAMTGAQAHFQDELAKRDTQIASFAETQRGTAVDAHVARLFQKRAIYSHQVDQTKALFTAAYNRSNIVTFAADAEGGEEQKVNFADALERVLMEGPKHNLTGEEIPNSLFVLPSGNSAEFSGKSEAQHGKESAEEWAKKNGPQTAGVR